MARNNQSWNLESFLDSLIIELDRARETLAVKALNKPLSYAVKDIALDLQLFPSFDGKQVKFLTAQPGETGASKVSIQLGSITDQQVRATSKNPITKDDVSLETIDEIDDDTKLSLRKIGVTSVKDLEIMENKNIDLEKVSGKNVTYQNLAGLLQKARRGKMPPSIKGVSLSLDEGAPVLVLRGDNLALDRKFEPVVVFNDELATVLSADSREIRIGLPAKPSQKKGNELVVTLDPFAIFKINLSPPARDSRRGFA
jgi:hypothetical protein